MLPLPQPAVSSSVSPSPPPGFISSTNHMVTAPSNLWGRVCKCVFLSSDLQIVPFIAFVTVKIKVPGWPAPQIMEVCSGSSGRLGTDKGSGPRMRARLSMQIPKCQVRLYARSEVVFPGVGILGCEPLEEPHM